MFKLDTIFIRLRLVLHATWKQKVIYPKQGTTKKLPWNYTPEVELYFSKKKRKTLYFLQLFFTFKTHIEDIGGVPLSKFVLEEKLRVSVRVNNQLGTSELCERRGCIIIKHRVSSTDFVHTHFKASNWLLLSVVRSMRTKKSNNCSV